MTGSLSWIGILRLGLLQTGLGSIVVLTTSTLNRVMVVELALPAMLPGALVAIHYALQVFRPAWGYGSDRGARRTPWIVGGMLMLACGGVLAAVATAWMTTHVAFGIALAVAAFCMIGAGVGAAGTSLLVLLAKETAESRRAAAATIVWVMMIVGFIVTTGVAGHLLDPFSPQRLVAVSAGVSVIAMALTLIGVTGVERQAPAAMPRGDVGQGTTTFRQAFFEVWNEPQARRFAIFVFVSMLAYSAQDLILEPFAGVVFAMTPGETTKLSGLQHTGTLIGMALVPLVGAIYPRARGHLRGWTIGGCLASALALLALSIAAWIGPSWPLRETVFLLGVTNGAYAVAAIGSMMALVSAGHGQREGVRMGLWGAAQAIAFGTGGFIGTLASDLARLVLASPAQSYGVTFAAEAMLFVVAAIVAVRVHRAPTAQSDSRHDLSRLPVMGSGMMDTANVYDVVVVGGGPSGATAATDLARLGHKVLLLDRAGRIKPCGGAIPPRLIRDFDIPDDLLVARVRAARMVSPADKRVDMPIDGGFVGMVDRDVFDEWLRVRAQDAGTERRTGFFKHFVRDADGINTVHFTTRLDDGLVRNASVRTRMIVGADGALSAVARQCLPGGDRLPYVFAYHEIVRSPRGADSGFDGARCDVYYRGVVSPDFYGWVFPHGDTVSVGTGSAHKGFSLRDSVGGLREAAGLQAAETIRREGAPIPLHPLPRWDDGHSVLLAGDAAGVVAPASGEGIYYAMIGGRLSAEAVDLCLRTGEAKALRSARKRFMRMHGMVFRILGLMQWYWYSNDRRRERFVSICGDRDVQKLTWDAYMNKQLVRAKPVAHVRIFFKNLAHMAGLARA